MCLENGERVYRSCGQERLVEKTKQMSITISKVKLPGFIYNHQKRDAILEPVKCGWNEHFGTLLPSKCMKPLSHNGHALFTRNAPPWMCPLIVLLL